ncbi:TetR/AcrR family transcriptional regulator [Streptomyces sp. NPDC059828]|uniref:TetR/AcrR family transcriptional regulator n=1 Tax=Streptomyces sp. NPDC059828 TaxID=3346965 RepID=UPI00364B8A2C
MSTHAPSAPSLQRARRPSLTARRKAATELGIARAAAELFAERGPDRTTADQIAGRAGVALRTFYRYYRGKQDAVAPLLADSAERQRIALAATTPGTTLPRALELSLSDALSGRDEAARESLLWTGVLLRAAVGDAALRTVWYRVHRDAEERLLPVLATLAGPGADPLSVRLTAVTATEALRVALETWAATGEPLSGTEASPAVLAVRCLRELTGGSEP